jgi:hypothetical protein
MAGMAALFIIPSLVFAGTASSKNIYVMQGEEIDGNFIAAGEQVIINGKVKGDVIVAGGTVLVNGAVAGDVIAAGGQVRISGPVQGDIRIAGGDVQVSGIIARNATIFGGNVQLMRESAIGWGLLAAAGNIEMLGSIENEAKVAAGAARINGTIGGDAWLKIAERDQLLIQPQAWVGGDLRVNAPTPARILSGATINGEVEYVAPKVRMDRKEIAGAIAAGLAGVFLLLKLLLLVGMWIYGFILVAAVPKLFEKVSKELQKKFWPSLGKGVVFWVGLPIASLVLLFTGFGWLVAGVAFGLYLLLGITSVIFISTYFGEWILKKITKRHWRKVSLYWSMLLGVFLFCLVVSIPFIGWLLKILLVSAGVGALGVILLAEMKRYR